MILAKFPAVEGAKEGFDSVESDRIEFKREKSYFARTPTFVNIS